MLPVKVIWDYTYYWGVLAQFFFHGRIADLGALADLRAELARCQRLNVEVQALLHDWSAAAEAPVANPARLLDQAALPWFAELNRSLIDTLDDAAFRERIRFSTRQMAQLAAEIAERALQTRGVTRPALATLLAGRPAAAGAPMLFPIAEPAALAA